MSEFLTPEELSARWKGSVTTGTLKNWRSTGKGPKPMKIGKDTLYSIGEVEAYEKNQTLKKRSAHAG